MQNLITRKHRLSSPLCETRFLNICKYKILTSAKTLVSGTSTLILYVITPRKVPDFKSIPSSSYAKWKLSQTQEVEGKNEVKESNLIIAGTRTRRDKMGLLNSKLFSCCLKLFLFLNIQVSLVWSKVSEFNSFTWKEAPRHREREGEHDKNSFLFVKLWWRLVRRPKFPVTHRSRPFFIWQCHLIKFHGKVTFDRVAHSIVDFWTVSTRVWMRCCLIQTEWKIHATLISEKSFGNLLELQLMCGSLRHVMWMLREFQRHTSKLHENRSKQPKAATLILYYYVRKNKYNIFL